MFNIILGGLIISLPQKRVHRILFLWIECSIGLIGKILWHKQTNYFCIHANNFYLHGKTIHKRFLVVHQSQVHMFIVHVQSS